MDLKKGGGCSFAGICSVPGGGCSKTEENSCDLAKDFKELRDQPCPIMERAGYPEEYCACDRPHKRIFVKDLCAKSEKCPAGQLNSIELALVAV